jgi:uncharacterized membrane protein
MMTSAWLAAAAAGAIAVAAGLADRGWQRRRNLDRIGWVDWRTVQMAALLGLMVAAGLALAPQ